MSKKLLQSIFFVLGLGIFIYLIYLLGWKVLLEKIELIGWWWIPLVLLALIWQFFHMQAWNEVLSFLGYRLSLWQLYKLKMIAEAVNMVVPSGNLGGDTVRAHLIRKQVPMNTAIPSVMVDKTLDFLSKMIFNIVGFTLILFFIEMPPVLFWSCTLYLIFIFFYNSLLVWIQVKGISGGLLKAIKWIPSLYQALIKRRDQLSLLDENLNRAYTQGKLKLFLAGVYHTIGRTLGVVEIWIVLWLLGEQPGFVEVLFLGVIVNVINGAFAIIPGQWGVSEYAQVLTAQVLGYTTAIGLSMAVIRRIRRLFLTGVGLIIYLLFNEEAIKIQTPEVEA